MSGELAVYQGSWLTLHTSSLKIGKWALVTPEGESEVAQSCLTLRDPMDYILPGSSVQAPTATPLYLLSRQEYWSGLPFSQEDLPHPGIEIQFLTLQADSTL